MAVSRLAPIDRATLAYLAFATLVFLARWAGGTGALAAILATHAGLAGIALSAPRLRARGGAARFLAEFYPLLFDLWLYTEIGLLHETTGVFHDAAVQGWEQALLGGQPAREWIRAWPWPWLSNTLHAGYLSYYFILAGAPLGLWAWGRRDGARRVLLVLMATFYACYAVFLLFPVAGPRYLFPLADNAATEAALARFTQWLLDGAAARGTAFPSSHVAVALVTAVAAAREWPAFGAPFLVAAVLLTLGTVYGQLHYAVDALAGAILAAAVLVLARTKIFRP
jgi:membrane-associated phospholipid phosphatase